ncbi:MAG: hypothetical protein U0572_08955 [Phycisphaerales bacterium]
MRNALHSALVVATLASTASAGIRYVDAAAAPGGDGLTWATAFRTLQPALAAAETAPTEIWLAQGVYKPELESSPGNPLTKVFLVPKSTSLYGGFAGNETSLSQRDPSAHVTVLSGDMLGNDSASAVSLDDNVHNVVRVSGAGVRSFDGLVITGGHRVNDGSNGGAICAIGASVTIRHCELHHNRSGWGGAVYAEGGASLVLDDCSIHDNVASNYGGGVYSDHGTLILLGGAVERNATLNFDGGGVRSQFGMLIANGTVVRKNVGKVHGGGIMATEGPVVVGDCEFRGNVAAGSGGGLFVQGATTNLSLSLFEGNKSSDAAGCRIALGGAANTVTGCEFSSNYATSTVAGLSLGNGGSFSVSSCAFHDNAALFAGGALGAYSCVVSVDSCTFERNRSPQAAAIDTLNTDATVRNALVRGNRGGGSCTRIAGAASAVPAIVENVTFESNHGSGLNIDFVANGSAVVSDCAFRGNLSDTDYGGLRLDRAARVSRCRFEENSAVQGGAAQIGGTQNVPITFANCAFTGNVSTANATGFGGGAIDAAYNGSHEFVNCVFSGNKAVGTGQGGAFRVASNSKITLENCTLAGNSAGGNGAGIFVGTGPSASATLKNCILWSNGGATQPQQIFSQGPPLALSSTTVQGWTGSLGGINNNGANPLFLDPNGADDVLGTPDDDLRLDAASPAIDSGSSALLPPDLLDLDGDGNVLEPLPLDLDDLPRVVGTVDRGAYESQR